MAERTIHIEGDSIRRETEEAIRAKEIEMAEARGWRRAVEALRDEAQRLKETEPRWSALSQAHRTAADYLESLSRTTPEEAPDVT